MTNQEDMQKAVLYQLLHKHLEELKQQGTLLEARFMEFEATKQALGDFKEIKGKDMRVPLGSGCYIKGKGGESADILVNIGANIMIRKPLAETVKLLQERVEEIENYSKNLQEQMKTVIAQINEITADLEKTHKH